MGTYWPIMSLLSYASSSPSSLPPSPVCITTEEETQKLVKFRILFVFCFSQSNTKQNQYRSTICIYKELEQWTFKCLNVFGFIIYFFPKTRSSLRYMGNSKFSHCWKNWNQNHGLVLHRLWRRAFVSRAHRPRSMQSDWPLHTIHCHKIHCRTVVSRTLPEYIATPWPLSQRILPHNTWPIATVQLSLPCSTLPYMHINV